MFGIVVSILTELKVRSGIDINSDYRYNKTKFYYVKKFKGSIEIEGEELNYLGERECNRFNFFIKGVEVFTYYYKEETPPCIVLLGYNRFSGFYGASITKDMVNFEFERFRVVRRTGKKTVEYFEVLEKRTT